MLQKKGDSGKMLTPTIMIKLSWLTYLHHLNCLWIITQGNHTLVLKSWFHINAKSQHSQSASNCLICPRPTSLDVKTHSYSSTPLLPKLNFFIWVLCLAYTKMLSDMPSFLNIFRISNKENRFHTLKNIECLLGSRHCTQSSHACQF